MLMCLAIMHWEASCSVQHGAGKRKGEHTHSLTLLPASSLTGVTLANMVPQSFQESFNEEEHLQPVLIQLCKQLCLQWAVIAFCWAHTSPAISSMGQLLGLTAFL